MIGSWIVKLALLALGVGLLFAGAGILKEAQVRRRVVSGSIVPRGAGREYQKRIKATSQLLNGRTNVELSWQK
ncbi:MAG TPA: hypothetical protein ENN51_02745 [candidate division WOR-3 bacterium]|uniref:Uncharacterized protein n=1 Tax=candidate division WOR-3 bacterium TaxID=2052148 RepID=A0A7V0T594_UNCW3|nr:hypothetical protein [candidate division WOR-3 bacterium]